MDFALNDDQRMLEDMVHRVVAKDYAFEQRQRYAQEPDGWSRAMWGQYAQLGLLALPFSAEHGGVGGGPVELMLVMQALGKALILEPYLSTVVIAGAVLRAGATARQRAQWIPRIAAGDTVLTLAHAEAQARYNMADVACVARRDHDAYVLDGRKVLVAHGDSADYLLVSARVHGKRTDRDGIGLWLVDARSPSVSRTGYRTVDGVRAADIRLDGVRVSAEHAIGEPGEAIEVLEHVCESAIAALAAEAVGAMSVCLDMTVDYLKVRHQFGGPIGRFQALQHRTAEMLIAVEQARSMAMLAALMVDEPDRDERRKALSAVKVQIGTSARFVGQEAIQLHGGIGITEECAVGHYFRRLTMIETTFGDRAHHLAQFARTGGFVEAA
jgi:pimeloyl-CoA dehydrogenase small subunit